VTVEAETHYARSGDVSIAYQVTGDGPFDQTLPLRINGFVMVAVGDQMVRAALDAATRWRAYAVAGASPSQSRVALVAHRGFYLLSQRLR